jgi:hypothetical protein
MLTGAMVLAAMAVTTMLSPAARADFTNSFAFGQPPEMVLNGSATYNGFGVNATAGGDQRGAIWHNVKQDGLGGFVATVEFKISTPTLTGDGFAIVFHNDPRGFNQLGGGGSELGYGDGFTNAGQPAWIEDGIAVEVDTFSFGFPGELDAVHVSLQGMNAQGRISANDAQSIANADASVLLLDDGNYHTMYVHYVAPTDVDPGRFTVNVNGQVLFTANNIDLDNLNGRTIFDDNGKTWVGITAATGLADSTHEFSNWAFGSVIDGDCIEPFTHSGFGLGCGLGCFQQFGQQWVGAQPMTFQWYKNGVAITDDEQGRLQGLTSQTFTINQPTANDFAYYRLVVTNPCGSADGGEFYWSTDAACNDIDYNNNGVFPEDQDVIDFFTILAGGDCTTTITQCDPIDFNNNGVFPEDQDVIDFFTVLAGGECP